MTQKERSSAQNAPAGDPPGPYDYGDSCPECGEALATSASIVFCPQCGWEQ